MDITKWSTPKSDYILCSQRWRSSIQSTKRRPGGDCGSDHDYYQIRLKLRTVGKITRPFRYDLNQIHYDYTQKVRNRLKGLDVIEYLMNYGQSFVTLYRRPESRPSTRKRNEKKPKWLSEEVLKIAVKRRKVKSKGEKERYKHPNAEFQRIARRG